MARPTGSANAAGTRRSLFLTTAIVTLVTATAGMQPASAQSVTPGGDIYNPSGSTPTPNWVVGGALRIGNGGSGTLDIFDGGKVTNDTGNDIFIGYAGGSQGTVTVKGRDISSGTASTWSIDVNLVVGQDGNGTLKIQDGGVVINGWGYIGAGGNSVSDVTVQGLGSTWTNSGQTVVGDHGDGTLNILDGGVVNTGDTATLGNQYDPGGVGSGTVTVSGHNGNNASTWNIGSTLNVGGS